MCFHEAIHAATGSAARAVRGPAAVLALGGLLAFAQPAHGQPGHLQPFKHYVVAGGYLASGVSLRGTGQNGRANGIITIAPEDVPADANVLAAFLYWETVTTTSGNGATGAQFNGYDISVIAKHLNPAGTPPCWSSGGATGGGSGRSMKAYRADVAPFLPVGGDGRRVAVGQHTVSLPDSGSGNSVPSTAGASLVIVYQDPAAGLTSVAIYDGGHTMNQQQPFMTQTLKGWYQPSISNPTAFLTHIVANGQSNFTERLTVTDANGQELLNVMNPFVGPSWDTYTTAVPLPGGSDRITVTVDRGGTTGSFDCLSWGAVIFSTTVQDSDRDGIIDILESPGTSGTIRDPYGRLLPDLYAMGARPDIKDLFVQIDYMKSTSGYSNPLQEIPAGHTHLPDRESLNMVARTFRFAPERINVHFDVGDHYQDGALPPGGWNSCPTASAAQWTPNCAIVRATRPDGVRLALGGQFIEETPCVPDGTNSCLFPDYPGPLPCSTLVTCAFPDFFGTVGWKSGFRFYRDEPLDFRKTKSVNGVIVDDGPDEPACHAAEADVAPDGTPILATNCRRRFDPARKSVFRHALFVHGVGIPRASVDDPTTAIDETRTPRNMSGMGDYAGGDVMVALGFWDRGVGTPFMQASTFLHELGHNLGLRHGGASTELNCKPNYQSMMNYLFQVLGLINAQGAAEIGFSRQRLPDLSEHALSEQLGLGTMLYRTRWYAPWNSSIVDSGLNTSPATKRCNGAPVAGELMARVGGTAVSGPIDWDANGLILPAPGVIAQDVNFSGALDQTLRGFNDWDHIDLRHTGSRRNVGGWSLDSGFWDAGFWDAGFSDAGFWDAGFWDAGFWDAGFWDAGFWDAGFWDAGVEADATIGELDLETAEALGNAPNALAATILDNKSVRLTWQPPHVGSDSVHFYEVYRVVGNTLTPANFQTRVLVGGAPVFAPTTTLVDSTVKKNTTYTYFVLAQFQDGRRSGISNLATLLFK
jgi:hypothetical protein